MNVIKFFPTNYAHCVLSQDFYKEIGLWGAIESRRITNVYQMKINPNTYKAIEEQLRKNWSRNQKTRCYKKSRAQEMISFDWMNYSPVQDENVPENEIWWEIANETAANV